MDYLKFYYLFTILVCMASRIQTLNNGLALTPPMGWLHWERFRCNLDCENDPDNCIREELFREMADRMAADGFLEAGYEYVIIDDCWLAGERDAEDRLQPDPIRFPSGIKALADYVHGKGLKFGIYEDYGVRTCAGYPGSLGYLEIDANTFAEWGVDYLKFDGCNVDADEAMEQGHIEMSMYLNQTGRPMVFSCEFPLYRGIENTNYDVAIEACNLWRNYGDMDDSWNSVTNIVNSIKDHQDLAQYAGPGHWNDPDELIIGNYGLSYEQSKAQMTIWAIVAAPLLMSVDLRTIQPAFRDILLNKAAINISQDALGIEGHLHTTIDSIDVWMKPTLPMAGEEFSYALGFVSNRVDGMPYRIVFTLEDFGLTNAEGYILMDVFDETVDLVSSTESLEVRVKPTGAVLFQLVAVEIEQ